MKRCFIDSNVILYANDKREKRKQKLAIDVVSLLMKKMLGVVSTQVLQEYANIALSKLGQESGIVLRQLKLLETLTVIPSSAEMVRRMVEIRTTYQTSFWDAGIVAAAEKSECDCILTEDLSSGQYYAGIEIINPFSSGFHIKEL